MGADASHERPIRGGARAPTRDALIAVAPR